MNTPRMRDHVNIAVKIKRSLKCVSLKAIAVYKSLITGKLGALRFYGLARCYRLGMIFMHLSWAYGAEL